MAMQTPLHPSSEAAKFASCPCLSHRHPAVYPSVTTCFKAPWMLQKQLLLPKWLYRSARPSGLLCRYSVLSHRQCMNGSVLQVTSSANQVNANAGKSIVATPLRCLLHMCGVCPQAQAVCVHSVFSCFVHFAISVQPSTCMQIMLLPSSL